MIRLFGEMTRNGIWAKYNQSFYFKFKSTSDFLFRIEIDLLAIFS
jgi:hypothetical protein